MSEGEARGFRTHPAAPCPVIVTRRNGRLHAWLDNCPHYSGGAPMAWRRDGYLDGSGAYLACHAHGALFDITSGDCVIGPCLGKRLTRVEIVETADGGVHVDAPIDWSAVVR